MAQITLGQLLHTNGNEPLGTTNGALNVALTGSNVQPVVETLTTTPLPAGGSGVSDIIDLTAAPGYGLVELAVHADTVTVVDVFYDDHLHSFSSLAHPHIRVPVHPIPATASPRQIIPAFRPMGGRMRIRWQNTTARDQTELGIYLYRYPNTEVAPRNVRAVLAWNLEIRDTVTHSPETDPQAMWALIRIGLGGGKMPIFVRSTLDQAVTIGIELFIRGVLTMTLGTFELPARSSRLITNADFPGIDVPSEAISITAKCSVAPTAGRVDAWVDTLVGGAA